MNAAFKLVLLKIRFMFQVDHGNEETVCWSFGLPFVCSCMQQQMISLVNTAVFKYGH